MSISQDWKPLVLRKSSATTTTNTSRDYQVTTTKTSSKSSISPSAIKGQNADSEDYKPLSITKEMASQIQKARVKKGWNQEQLARVCCIPKTVVSEYEQGKGVYNREYLNPICKHLNINLKKPTSQ